MKLEKKNIILLSVIALLLWLSYSFAISKTIQYKSENTRLKSEIAVNDVKLDSLADFQQLINSNINNQSINGIENIRSYFLELNNNGFSSTVSVSEITDSFSYTDGNNVSSYSKVMLSGSYLEIEKVLYDISSRLKGVRLIHLNYERTKKNGRYTKKLIAEAVFEQRSLKQ